MAQATLSMYVDTVIKVDVDIPDNIIEQGNDAVIDYLYENSSDFVKDAEYYLEPHLETAEFDFDCLNYELEEQGIIKQKD